MRINSDQEHDAAIQELDKLFDQYGDEAWELQRTRELLDAIEAYEDSPEFKFKVLPADERC